MTDDLPDVDLPDVRVITITLQPPEWLPVIDSGDDFDDYTVVQVLEIAWRKARDELFECVGLLEIEMDDDDDD